MDSRKWMHLVLALLMALWSPAWCQCVLLAATQSQAQAAVEPAFSRGEPCDDIARQLPVSCDEINCCDELTVSHDATSVSAAAQISATAALECCAGANGSSHLTGTPCGCHCCEQLLVAALVQFDSFTLPGAWLLPACLVDQSWVACVAEWSALPLGSTDWGASPPHFRQSLFAQRALLLV